MLRYLRITLTALSLTACVLLTALWVRSIQQLDEVYVPTSTTSWIGTSSIKGQLQFYTGVMDPEFAADYLKFESFDAKSGRVQSSVRETNWAFYLSGIHDWYFCAPHWFLALLTAAISAIPWIKWSKRFSLRTLLIATTLVAVGLGLIVMAS